MKSQKNVTRTCWEEVGNRTTGNDAKQQSHEDIGLDIQKGELEAMPERLSLTTNPIIHTNIFLKPPNSKLTFFLRQPPGGTREVWKDEESDESDCDGDATFDDDYS